MRKTFTYEGQRHYIRCQDLTEYEVKKAMIIRDIEEGRVHITKETLVKVWSEQYLETYRRPRLRNDGAYKTLRTVRRKWVDGFIGGMRMKDVKPIDIVKILNKMGEQNFSRNYMKRVREFLYGMFDEAMSNGIILNNPAKRLKLPSSDDGVGRPCTTKERKLLLEACEINPYGLWARLMLRCGLRPEETSRVKGMHIDIENKRLFIDGTKSKKAKRYVPIPDDLLDDLAKFADADRTFEYVFVNGNGQPLNSDNRRKYWKSIKKTMHILAGGKTDYGELQRVIPPYVLDGDFVPYCLRHTYGTELGEMGVPIEMIMELMGHTDIKMTKRYVHPTEVGFEFARIALNKKRAKECGEVDKPV